MPKDKDQIHRKLEYRYVFSHRLSPAVISNLVATVTEIATPTVAWQQGVIIQDVPVTVRLKQDTEGMCTSLNVNWFSELFPHP